MAKTKKKDKFPVIQLRTDQETHALLQKVMEETSDRVASKAVYYAMSEYLRFKKLYKELSATNRQLENDLIDIRHHLLIYFESKSKIIETEHELSQLIND